MSLPAAETFYPPNPTRMSNKNIFHITFRVKATVNALYNVPGLPSRRWQEGFQAKVVSAHLHGILITLHLK